MPELGGKVGQHEGEATHEALYGPNAPETASDLKNLAALYQAKSQAAATPAPT
jgi:hypothetical protein